MSRQELQKIYAILQAQVMEDIVQESGCWLCCQYTSVVVAPNLAGDNSLLQLIPLDEFNVLLVLVVDPWFSQPDCETSRPLTAQEIARINHFLNAGCLRGAGRYRQPPVGEMG